MSGGSKVEISAVQMVTHLTVVSTTLMTERRIDG